MNFKALRIVGIEKFVVELNIIEEERKYNPIWETLRVRSGDRDEIYTMVLYKLNGDTTSISQKKAGFKT